MEKGSEYIVFQASQKLKAILKKDLGKCSQGAWNVLGGLEKNYSGCPKTLVKQVTKVVKIYGAHLVDKILKQNN